jgi:hypothetical protein
MADLQPRYCLDTSAWLDGWRRYYPIHTFPSLWDRVEDLIRSGRLHWAEEVAHEILDHDLTTWLTPHVSAVIQTAAIWNQAQTILRTYNPDLHEKGILDADPFVIAAAQTQSLVVVTGELSSSGRPKIPDVCDQLKIGRMSFLQMIQQEGWKF